MPRLVTMVAEIIEEACTGCDLCVKVCSTAALYLEPRKEGEPGRGKRIARLHEDACYNIQNCLEICPEDAIVMRELDEPFMVNPDLSAADPKAVAALCQAVGLAPHIGFCICTGTTVGEVAAAIVLGADTPEKVSLTTGARTGCTEICVQPIMQLLAAAGHGDKPKTVEDGYQTYSICGTLYEHIGPTGELPPELRNEFPDYYRVQSEISDLMRLRAQTEQAMAELQKLAQQQSGVEAAK